MDTLVGLVIAELKSDVRQLLINRYWEEWTVIESEAAKNLSNESVTRIWIMTALSSRVVGSGLLDFCRNISIGTRVILNASNDILMLSSCRIEIHIDLARSGV